MIRSREMVSQASAGGCAITHYARAASEFGTREARKGRRSRRRIIALASLKSIVMSPSDIHDIVVYSSDRRPALVVEVKAARETFPDRASALRRSLLQRDRLLGESFFLLAYSTSLFLWDKNAPANAKQKTAAAGLKHAYMITNCPVRGVGREDVRAVYRAQTSTKGGARARMTGRKAKQAAIGHA
ncbi:MAG: hypothetical protein WDO68_24120 [Gammaproteobacteria bacterium]